MSRNLVEIIRRHHAVGAPTALEVLKEAMEQRGEITDDDRRLAAERSGLPEAAVHGVSTFYDDLLAPRGARHVRVCTGTACFAATGDAHVDALREGLGAIPTLCFDERRAPSGACRVCMAGIAGLPGPAAACTTLCRDGMVIDTMTRRTGNVDLVGSNWLELHPADAARLWVSDGDAVSVRSAHGRIELPARVTKRIEPGHVFTAFHFPEIRTNRLIGSSADVNTSCPEYKVVAVDVRPVAEHASRTPAIASAT